MRKLFLAFSFLTATSAFAGGYSFDCSNKDASITISDQGNTVKVFGKTYSSVIKLRGLEIWEPLDDAEVEVLSAGKRTVLKSFKDNSCREITELTFAKRLRIRDRKSKQEIATDYFICENSSATTTGGRDCSAGE